MLSLIVVLVIGGYGVLIVHELGHFLAARWFGMKVLAVCTGVGPRFFSRRDRLGTLWEMRLFPVGAWLNLDEGPLHGEGTRKNREFAERAAVYVAGPVANVLLALTIYLLVAYLLPTAKHDATTLYLLAAFSLGIGLFNLIPIPPLDGGHMLLVAIEACQGKPLSKQRTNRFRIIGMLGITLCSIASVAFFLIKALSMH